LNIEKLVTLNYPIITLDGKYENTMTNSAHKNYILILGSEGQGISDELAKLANFNFNIKTNEQVESLNVGMAASIALYELNQRNNKL